MESMGPPPHLPDKTETNLLCFRSLHRRFHTWDSGILPAPQDEGQGDRVFKTREAKNRDYTYAWEPATDMLLEVPSKKPCMIDES